VNLLVGIGSGGTAKCGPLALDQLYTACGTSSPPVRQSDARWMSLKVYPVSTVGRLPGNFGQHSEPVPAASARCGNSITCADC
jgi:hypothetical protein